jgi:hypothetical protein
MAHPTGFEPVASAFGGQAKAASERAEELISAGFEAEQGGKARLLLGHYQGQTT